MEEYRLKKLLFLGVITTLLLIGCSDSTKQDEGAHNFNTNLDNTSTYQGYDPFIGEYSIGDTVQMENLHITLNGVRETYGYEFEELYYDKFLLVNLTIENKGDEPERVSTFQMSLQDDESYIYNAAHSIDARGSLNVEIGAGRKVRGEVAFDVPESDYYEFIFENAYTLGQVFWKF